MELGCIKCDREDLTFIVAGLVREGVTFEVHKGSFGRWEITLTGGY